MVEDKIEGSGEQTKQNDTEKSLERIEAKVNNIIERLKNEREIQSSLQMIMFIWGFSFGLFSLGLTLGLTVGWRYGGVFIACYAMILILALAMFVGWKREADKFEANE